MWFLPVSILVGSLATLMLIHIVRDWSNPNKDGYKKFNEVIYVLITFAFALYYPLVIIHLAGEYPGIFFATALEDLTFLGNLFIVGIMIGVFLWAVSAKIRTIRNPELLKEQNNYEVFCKKFMENYPSRNKIKRRITHILPPVVVCGIIVITSFFKPMLGDAWFNYGMFYIVIIGLLFALTFLVQDLIRLYDYSFMPPNAARMCMAGLEPHELDSFSSTFVMVFGFAWLLFFSFPIFLIALLITAVADAMAALFGIIAAERDWNHKFPKGTNKSLAGYMAGFTFTFICVLFGVSFSNFFGLSNWSMTLTFSLALLLSVAFLSIDIITSVVELQDNYLNPMVMGFTTIVYLMVLNLPFI